jgi:GNAT superfamily N-acetyltransferase
VTIVRPAREDDLAELFRIQLRALNLEDLLERFAHDEVPHLVRHGFERGNTMVAEGDEGLMGFAVGLERDESWFLGEFFVLPNRQSGGVGQRLLSSVVPRGMPIATVSTSDRRAQALYTRAGMTPRWPNYELTSSASALSIPAARVDILPAAPDDPTWAAWDQKVCGRDRYPDLEFHCGPWNALRFWIERSGRRTGYAGIARRAPGRMTIGPVGVLQPGDAGESLLAVVDWALSQPGTESINLDVPGPHPALASLLTAGFRIADVNVFCASEPSRYGDPRRYIPMTAALY